MSDKQTIYVHSVETLGALDGPGLRYIVFFSGCPLRCIYCHNPDTQNINDGKPMQVSELVADILEYKSFLQNGGVTLSGGEPLFQPEGARTLLHALKREGLHTALDTAGSVDTRLSGPALREADLVLLDIKALDDALCRDITSNSAQNTLRTLKFLNDVEKPVWIRHVLLPGYTLDEKRLSQLAKFLTRFDCIEKVELLPFHKMGEHKWKELGRPYQLYDTKEPSAEEVEAAKEIFLHHGFSVQ